MSVKKPQPKKEKPDFATQILMDSSDLIRDRLRLREYNMSPGLKEAVVAAFTKPAFGDIIYSTSDHLESVLAFVIPTLLQNQKKALIFSPSYLHQRPMQEYLNEFNLDTAIYNHRTDFDTREEMKDVFTDPESKLNFFHATPEMYTKGHAWLTVFLDEVTRLKKVDYVIVTHAEWILDECKRFKDFENLQDLKDSNRSIKWIILGKDLGRNNANKIARTFGLRNPHYVDDEGQSLVLIEKPFYYQLGRCYYLDKVKYFERY